MPSQPLGKAFETAGKRLAMPCYSEIDGTAVGKLFENYL